MRAVLQKNGAVDALVGKELFTRDQNQAFLPTDAF